VLAAGGVAIRPAARATEMITIYAEALGRIAPRLAPVHIAMRDAAAHDADCAALYRELSQRRARNIRLFAADLRTTGELRADLSDDEVADIVWSMALAEYHLLLAQDRGWTPQQYSDHLRDAWVRLLLTE
jgi:hypothetical protein